MSRQCVWKSTDRRQELRFLRNILWLDRSDQAARQQLSLLLGTHGT